MATDIEGMLRRVVNHVFDEDTVIEYSQDPRTVGYIFQAKITSTEDRRSSVGLRASHEWSDAFIFDLAPGVDVSATLFEYEDDEPSKEANLRALAAVLRAYLRGEGRVEHRLSMLRRRPRPNYFVTLDGHEWQLGKYASRSHYPD